jgi:hypothetical protein
MLLEHLHPQARLHARAERERRKVEIDGRAAQGTLRARMAMHGTRTMGARDARFCPCSRT